MSLPFSDTTTKKGIIQEIETECGFRDGDISGNTTLLKKFTSSVNLALDDFWAIAIPASGKWQLDDSNQTDYPIITANLVSGQRDYAFSSDGSSNLILDIYKVLAANSSGVFTELAPVDQQNGPDVAAFLDGRNGTGIPSRFDKTGNGLFLDPIPSYNYTNGLKVLINREASYFTSSDTTKKPGVPGIFHRYFVINPAFSYARSQGLQTYNRLSEEKVKLEESIRYHFAGRERGVRRAMTPNIENNK